MIRIVAVTILVHGLSQHDRTPQSRGHLLQNGSPLPFPFITTTKPSLHRIDVGNQLLNQKSLTMRAFLENSYLPVCCLQLRTSTLALLTMAIDPLVEGLKIFIDALDSRTNPFINCIHLEGNVRSSVSTLVRISVCELMIRAYWAETPAIYESHSGFA